jgi:hypothetical protein
MLTHADVRHLILTHKWIQEGHAFNVEYIQKKINEVALKKDFDESEAAMGNRHGG